MPWGPLPSTGSRWVGSPASSVLRGPPTSRRPSPRARLPSPRGTAPSARGFAPAGGERRAHGPGGSSRGPPVPALCRTEAPGSPRFLGSPSRACPVLRPRWAGPPSPLSDGPVLPSGTCIPSASTKTFRGSITRPTRSLSTLRSPGHPGTTQDSLPACWLGFGRAGLSPAGLLPRVSRKHRSSLSLRAKLSWRTHVRTCSGSTVAWSRSRPRARGRVTGLVSGASSVTATATWTDTGHGHAHGHGRRTRPRSRARARLTVTAARMRTSSRGGAPARPPHQ